MEIIARPNGKLRHPRSEREEIGLAVTIQVGGREGMRCAGEPQRRPLKGSVPQNVHAKSGFIQQSEIRAPIPIEIARHKRSNRELKRNEVRVGERPAREIGEDEEPIASGNKEISPRIVIPLRHERSHRVPRGRDRKRRHLVHHAVPHASDVPPTLSFPHDDQINRHTKDRPIQQTERWPTPRRQDQNGGHNGQRDRPRISKSTPTIAQENERARLDTIGEDDVHMPVAIQIARLELSGHRRHGERTRAHPIRNRLELQDAAR